MKRFIKVCEYILLLLFLVLIPFMRDKLSLLLGIPIIVIIYFLNKKIDIKNFPLFIFIISIIIRVLVSIFLKTDITDDFKTMLDASHSLLRNDLSFINTEYFNIYPYQIGHVLYQALLLRIINSVLFLKIINSIITSLIVVFIYLISKKLFKEKTARLISILYLLYLYPLYLNTVLTNQHLPALLSLIVIYLVVSKKINYKLSILIGLLLAIANVFRTESIIFILSITVYYILTMTKDNYKMIIKSILLIIVSYFVIFNSISIIVSLTPIKTRLTNNSGYWKFYCGLNYESNGIYNNEDAITYFNENKDGKELLINRVKENKTKLPVLFLKKEVILWTQTNYDLRINNNINSNIFNFLLHFNQGYLNLILLLFIVSLSITKYERKETLLLKILIFIYYGVYMFIEISPRYAYILHMILFILLGLGIEKISDIIKMRWKHAKV